jgi:hypothetical protein
MIFTFEPKGGPIFVAGVITGPSRNSAVRLILDTGATTSLINLDVLSGIGFDPIASASASDRIEQSRSRSTRAFLGRLHDVIQDAHDLAQAVDVVFDQVDNQLRADEPEELPVASAGHRAVD